MIPCIERPVKDGPSVIDYLDADLQDAVVETMIRQIYTTFKAFFRFHFLLFLSFFLLLSWQKHGKCAALPQFSGKHRAKVLH